MATKTEWFWSEDALVYWHELDNRLRKLITVHAQDIFDKENKDTITKTDIQNHIQNIYKELAEYERQNSNGIKP